eukprot:scaffold364_cov224-Alexandrium_tamarense.AAC.11
MNPVYNRRIEELEALHAYYGNDLLPSLIPPSSDTPTSSPSVNGTPVTGPWFLRIRHQYECNESNNEINRTCSSIGIPTLEIRLPASYPFGNEPPEPVLHNAMMNPQLKRELLQDLIDMYEEDMDIAILWGERCREELLSFELSSACNNADDDVEGEVNDDGTNSNRDRGDDRESSETRTYIPSSSRFGQSIRHFPLRIITNESYRRDNIVHTPPFHPPKSGASEIMIAHVGKASHNMFAYRFMHDGITVSDNDDDGEKGSGTKIASLLQMSGVENVIVVVSRWFGGVHLGPARFKWIASVARDGLRHLKKKQRPTTTDELGKHSLIAANISSSPSEANPQPAETMSKPPPKPPRPFTAYNQPPLFSLPSLLHLFSLILTPSLSACLSTDVYFQLERSFLLQTHPDYTPEIDDVPKEVDDNVDVRPMKYRNITLSKNWYTPRVGEDKKKRQHHKNQ